MNNLKIYLIGTALVLLSACNGAQQDSRLHFTTSMESAYAWQDNPPPSITWSNDARSGNYVCKLDSLTPYGVTFNMKLSDISSRPLKSVRISAWVNMSTMTSDPLLAIDVKDSSGKSIEWFSKPAKDYVAQPNHWEQMVFDLDLREKDRNRRSNYLRIYMMNMHRDYSMVDDMELQFHEQ